VAQKALISAAGPVVADGKVAPVAADETVPAPVSDAAVAAVLPSGVVVTAAAAVTSAAMQVWLQDRELASVLLDGIQPYC
jgi:hypothetical protein